MNIFPEVLIKFSMLPQKKIFCLVDKRQVIVLQLSEIISKGGLALEVEVMEVMSRAQENVFNYLE